MPSVSVEVVNKTRYNDTDELVRRFLKSSIMFLRKNSWIKAERVSLSVAFVGQKAIKNLNKTYRKKDLATDVLSFGYENSQKLLSADIVICLDFIKKYSTADKKRFDFAIKENVAHGLLHAIGLEHSKKMFDLQKKLAAEEK